MVSKGSSRAGFALALFLFGAGYLFWMESAQIHLRLGIKLNKESHPAAVRILRGGIAKDSSNYMLHHYLAKALYAEAFREQAQGVKSSIMLIEAKKELYDAHTLRFDSFNYLLRASIYEAEGDLDRYLTDLNLSFFFSQNPKELKRLLRLKGRQTALSEKLLKGGSVTAALIVAFNHISRYKPFWNPDTAGTLLKDFFLSIPPALWLEEAGPKEPQKRKELLRDIFKNLDANEKKDVLKIFSSAGFGFLSEFLSK